MSKNKYRILETAEQNICTLGEIKNYLRISHAYDDILINKLILAAIDNAENFLSLRLITRSVELTSSQQGQRIFKLKYKPIIRISNISIKEKDIESTIHESKYDLDELNGILILQNPLQYKGLLVVQYSSGFIEDTIPWAVKQGIFIHVSEMYDREEVATPSLSQEIKNLYLPYRQLKI